MFHSLHILILRTFELFSLWGCYEWSGAQVPNTMVQAQLVLFFPRNLEAAISQKSLRPF